MSLTSDAVMNLTPKLLDVENKMSLLGESLQIANTRQVGAVQASGE